MVTAARLLGLTAEIPKCLADSGSGIYVFQQGRRRAQRVAFHDWVNSFLREALLSVQQWPSRKPLTHRDDTLVISGKELYLTGIKRLTCPCFTYLFGLTALMFTPDLFRGDWPTRLLERIEEAIG